jgi:hypothetical protein
MTSATKILTEQIRMLQDLRKLSLKPRFMDAVKLFINDPPSSAVPLHPNGNGTEKRSAIWDTGITEAVVATLQRMQGEFTYPDVLKALAQDGYRNQSARPRDSVGRVLRNLATRGKIREVRKGNGGRSTVYKRID